MGGGPCRNLLLDFVIPIGTALLAVSFLAFVVIMHFAG